MVSLVPVSGLHDAQHALFTEWAEVYAAAGRHVLGDRHDVRTADEMRELERSPNHDRRAVAAIDADGTVVGAASVVMPLRDNLRLAYLLLAVLPDRRGQGIGGQLLTWAEETAAAAGRSVAQTQTQWLEGEPDESGTFATARGYAPGQTLLRSDLALTPDGVRSAEPAVLGDDYALETAIGGIPASWLHDRALLARSMSADVPTGDLDLEEEDWDEERLQGEFATVARMGRQVVETVARYVPTGQLVGFTQVQLPKDSDGIAYQQDTLVLREHRGHGLGRSLKAANTLAVLRELVDVRAIRTWNADDNTHMLAVNRELGYVVSSRTREWQKVLA